jgi:FixJ family two-component response regulator
MGPPVMLIHIVEDDAAVCDSMSLLLSESGCDVISHCDAESFLAAAPPGGDDVVFIDLVLPGLGGAAVVRWLQALKHPPRIVVMSGQSKRRIEMELNGLDRLQVLRKPLTRDAVAAQIALGAC